MGATVPLPRALFRHASPQLDPKFLFIAAEKFRWRDLLTILRRSGSTEPKFDDKDGMESQSVG